MALTATNRLMRRCNMQGNQVGKLQVGSEFLLDRSKSMKTEIVALSGMEQYADIEGVDSYSARQGGIAAFIDCIKTAQLYEKLMEPRAGCPSDAQTETQ